MKKKEKEKNDNFKILVHRLVSQILIRKDAQWSGLEARRITAVAHQFLFLNTEPVEFRKLTSAVYYVGKYVDTTPSLMRTLSYDWKEIEEHSYKLLKGHVDNSLVDRFINEVKSRIISYDFDHYKVVDWVEYINKIFSGLEINDENIDLSSKLELSSVIDDFLDLRFEALANYAAENQELNVDDIILSIYELTLNKKNETLARVYNNSPVTLGEEGMSYYIHQINLRSDLGCLYHIKKSFLGFPDVVVKQTVEKWLRLENARPLAEKLWTKVILGSSGKLREMKILSRGSHYRLIYRSDKNSERPFLAFGLRRDLKYLIEISGKYV